MMALHVDTAQGLSSLRHTAQQGRSIFIWGAGNQGRGLFRALDRLGIAAAGFIDKSPELQRSGALGRQVVAPEAFLRDAISRDPRPFVIIAVFFFEREVSSQLDAGGMVKGHDYLAYTSIKPYDYAIDISGSCNLRCMSCPRARRPDKHPREGFMTPEVFTQVLDKIIAEDPLAGSVQLYQWGEPLLNPRVAEIIGIANARGIQTAVSSNLNSDRNLAEAVRAKPSWFRVSVSGWGADYEITHTGGSWESFHRNFLALAKLRREHNPDMKTEVYYHLYKHNQGAERRRVQQLCEEAGFEFHPVYAYLISLDDVLEHLEGAPLPEAACKAADMLALGLSEGMERARKERAQECLTLRCVHINWDLSVSNCMMFFYPEGNRAVPNFLDVPLTNIVKNRASCALCKRCMKQALHRYCSVYSTATAADSGTP